MEEATTSPSTATIFTRLFFFTSLLFLSVYANYESSKHFDISVSLTPDSYPHRRFNLLFISNGRASSILLGSSIQMQKTFSLCLKKLRYVRHVHVQLGAHDLHAPVMVDNGFEPGSFVITLNPNLMKEKDAVKAVETELRKVMTRLTMRDRDEEMVDMIAGSGAKKDNMIRLWLEEKSWCHVSNGAQTGGMSSM